MPVEYDFLKWTSFPSSVKITNPSSKILWDWKRIVIIPVKPGSTIRAECMIKREGLAGDYWGATVHFDRRVPATPEHPLGWAPLFGIDTPPDVFSWTKWTRERKIPADVDMLRVYYGCARARVEGGTNIAWFDDLRVYMDDKLIYENKFSNWLPYQIAGAVITAIPIGLYAARRMPKITVPEEWWK